MLYTVDMVLHNGKLCHGKSIKDVSTCLKTHTHPSLVTCLINILYTYWVRNSMNKDIQVCFASVWCTVCSAVMLSNAPWSSKTLSKQQNTLNKLTKRRPQLTFSGRCMHWGTADRFCSWRAPGRAWEEMGH